MESPEEFAARYLRRKRGWWEKFLENSAVAFVGAGISGAILSFYDNWGQMSVPFLLAGIACLLFILVAAAEGILGALDYLIGLQRIGKGEKGQ